MLKTKLFSTFGIIRYLLPILNQILIRLQESSGQKALKSNFEQKLIILSQKHKFQQQMEKEKAEPEPTPSLSSQDEPFMPNLMEHLSLNQKSSSFAGTEQQQTKQKKAGSNWKSKLIQKSHSLKRSYKKQEGQKKNSYKKQVARLQNKINELQSEIERMKRKMESCPQCRHFSHSKEQSSLFDNYHPKYQEQMKKIACSLNDSRGSINSVQFQNIDFSAPIMVSKEIDDKAWVYTGILMIAMGSKCLEVDGTINVFRILKQSIDTLRRQVQKSQKNISMDFYLTNQEMKESDFMQDVGFDPFTEKIGGDTGLNLEGIKVESVEQFQLIYDNKLTYNIKYDAMIGAMEYIRQNSWLTF